MSRGTLLLDAGNSRIKWAILQAGEWLADGASLYENLDMLFHEWDRFPAPKLAVGCNVAGEDKTGLIQQYWKERDVQIDWVHASESACGVTNLYEKPEQLGADRWAALVGAWYRAKDACLVVSAGTALTVDAINRRGEFMGGLILPGKRLMQESLVSGTHGLDVFSGQSVELPRNTADAMASGTTIALTSAVMSAFQRLSSTESATPLCIVTGGDAEWLAEHLAFGVIIAPRLVLEGLLILSEGTTQA